MKLPELLIPAGNQTKLNAALAYGADAVYVGAGGLSMRPDESSFSMDEIGAAVETVKAAGRRIYLGINSMFFEEDFPLLTDWIEAAGRAGVDAVIVSDAGAFRLVREKLPEMKIHISTQVSTSNPAGARFWKEAGAGRIVLARECTLEQAGRIAEQSGIEVEIFVHGAMCMAVSGRCLLSAHLCGHSASRGQCKHSCRWEWQLVEKSRPGEAMPVFENGRETIFLGSSDLCLARHIPELVQSGISSLKVEGRMKSEYYVATVTRIYRLALDSFARDPDNYEFRPEWLAELDAVSHRAYSTGFAFGYPERSPADLQTMGDALSTHDFLGMVEAVSDGVHVIRVKNPFAVGEDVEFISPGTSAMVNGIIAAEEITNEQGVNVARSHCGTLVRVKFERESDLPVFSILRRPR